ncbi:hypothetical protein A3H16_01785 [Candidatus Kaiserbacteria bacterium RIFCSPLOWO2_12_FULL_53_8]|uniref:Peptidase A24A N-terminal domain-containing protein n=2 Tax=Candidatus Kaiseribacteriota TaxID=1752734 RepID=A0A1F6CWE6_9BACT|nr:MAG: hypothetical protein A2851_04180 [Candidatus Kaiserbacteria bacterium RIFCSPHIGHO2_01_FULL_53_29]OGG91858.1 MAG: hypothetical protein A3H16_01785 [Candidatus Kaiserbacteria bacterium RIFCSPLOWO2_12_FULL_53_8]
MIPLALGIFGLIVGSFLNVLIIRHGVRSIGGRSACMACGRQLLWHDMIPVVSWITLAGRCRHCRTSISPQYPLVEAATGILFAMIGAAPFPTDIAYKLLFCTIAALLIAITVYDLRHTIIPDLWAYTFAGLALFSALAFPIQTTNYWPTVLLAGPIAALPLFAFWFFSRGRWMGLGDAKLALGIGWLLGPIYGIFAVFLAFIIGAVVSVCVLLPLPHIVRLFKKAGIARSGSSISYTMKSEIPFGPFLIVSCFIVWFSILYNVNIFGLFGVVLP